MARKPKRKRKNNGVNRLTAGTAMLTARVPSALLGQVKAIASKQQTSTTAVVRDALGEFVNKEAPAPAPAGLFD
jgi:predicted transcriptional regulator